MEVEKDFKTVNTINDLEPAFSKFELNVDSIRLTDNPLDDYQRLYLIECASRFNTINFKIEETSYKSRLIYQIEETYKSYLRNVPKSVKQISTLHNRTTLTSDSSEWQARSNSRSEDNIGDALITINDGKNNLADNQVKNKKVLTCLEYSVLNIWTDDSVNEYTNYRIFNISNPQNKFWKEKLGIPSTANNYHLLNGTVIFNRTNNDTNNNINNDISNQNLCNDQKSSDQAFNSNMNDRSIDSDNVVYSITKNKQYKLNNMMYNSDSDRMLINPNNAIIYAPDANYIYIYGIWKLYQDIMIGLITLNRGKADEKDNKVGNEMAKDVCTKEYEMVMVNLFNNSEFAKSTIKDATASNNGCDRSHKKRYIEFKWKSISKNIQTEILDSSRSHLQEYKDFIVTKKFNLNNLPMVQKVRGGFVRIQGTWLHTELARPLCIFFGFPIRYLLVPVFGPQFSIDCEAWFKQRNNPFSLHSIKIHYPKNESLMNCWIRIKKTDNDTKTTITNKTKKKRKVGAKIIQSNISEERAAKGNASQSTLPSHDQKFAPNKYICPVDSNIKSETCIPTTFHSSVPITRASNRSFSFADSSRSAMMHTLSPNDNNYHSQNHFFERNVPSYCNTNNSTSNSFNGGVSTSSHFVISSYNSERPHLTSPNYGTPMKLPPVAYLLNGTNQMANQQHFPTNEYFNISRNNHVVQNRNQNDRLYDFHSGGLFNNNSIQRNHANENVCFTRGLNDSNCHLNNNFKNERNVKEISSNISPISSFNVDASTTAVRLNESCTNNNQPYFSMHRHSTSSVIIPNIDTSKHYNTKYYFDVNLANVLPDENDLKNADANNKSDKGGNAAGK